MNLNAYILEDETFMKIVKDCLHNSDTSLETLETIGGLLGEIFDGYSLEYLDFISDFLEI